MGKLLFWTAKQTISLYTFFVKNTMLKNAIHKHFKQTSRILYVKAPISICQMNYFPVHISCQKHIA